jgi:hypothetical protein
MSPPSVPQIRNLNNTFVLQLYSPDMSRYCGDDNPEPIFRAADAWRTQALGNNGSVLSGGALWTLSNIEAIERHYVDA